MAVWVEALIGEPVICHYFSAHEGFEGESGEHVEAKTARCFFLSEEISQERSR